MSRGLGDVYKRQGDEIKEVTILGRTLRWTEEGLEYEADGKHVRDLMEAEGLNENSNTVVSPVVKPKSKLEDEESEELGREEVKEYRGEAAKLNYLGGDRPDMPPRRYARGWLGPRWKARGGSRGQPGSWWVPEDSSGISASSMGRSVR